MTAPAVGGHRLDAPEERDIALRSGRIRARCWGFGAGVRGVVMCIPGLSSNSRCFDRIAASLVSAGRQVAALDLRGRAGSEATAPGTYGWPAHARDVVEAAARLGADRFDLVGHSMGAYVAMQLAADRPDRVERLVLIDGAGIPQPAALEPIAAGLLRLDRWHADAEAYVAAIRAGGVVRPWGDLWDDFYRYELETAADGRVRARTSLRAVLEDVEYGRRHRQDALWPRLRGPALLVRAAFPLGDSGGYIVAPADAQRFATEIPAAGVIEIAANHFGVLTHPQTSAAIGQFLSSASPSRTA